MSSIRDSSDDRTTRARVRAAAIELFARHGFGTTVRAIADAAGVSPGLVIHHFESKAGLRAECDEAVLIAIGDEKSEMIGTDTGADYDSYLAALADDEHSQTQILYLLRAVAEGGEVGRTFLARTIAQTEKSMREGVAAGRFRPSIDEAGRARYLAYISMGALVMDTVLHPPEDWSDSVAILRGYVDRVAVPGVEYAVHGLGLDPAVMDSVIEHRRTAGSSVPDDSEPLQGGTA
ncbi:MAG: TetR family transcriptional regulator [Gordonia sp. (in: high G+C Gram-positive bacteria)]|uniref:TetR/AcrR family transcriptional regulator n=1 Tax=Gordonia sp. (in: high G+C Gram-positive bacteria) TaxID=84139 RepID=UPI0039E65BD7